MDKYDKDYDVTMYIFINHAIRNTRLFLLLDYLITELPHDYLREILVCGILDYCKYIKDYFLVDIYMSYFGLTDVDQTLEKKKMLFKEHILKINVTKLYFYMNNIAACIGFIIKDIIAEGINISAIWKDRFNVYYQFGRLQHGFGKKSASICKVLVIEDLARSLSVFLEESDIINLNETCVWILYLLKDLFYFQKLDSSLLWKYNKRNQLKIQKRNLNKYMYIKDLRLIEWPVSDKINIYMRQIKEFPKVHRIFVKSNGYQNDAFWNIVHEIIRTRNINIIEFDLLDVNASTCHILLKQIECLKLRYLHIANCQHVNWSSFKCHSEEIRFSDCKIFIDVNNIGFYETFCMAERFVLMNNNYYCDKQIVCNIILFNTIKFLSVDCNFAQEFLGLILPCCKSLIEFKVNIGNQYILFWKKNWLTSVKRLHINFLDENAGSNYYDCIKHLFSLLNNTLIEDIRLETNNAFFRPNLSLVFKHIKLTSLPNLKILQFLNINFYVPSWCSFISTINNTDIGIFKIIQSLDIFIDEDIHVELDTNAVLCIIKTLLEHNVPCMRLVLMLTRKNDIRVSQLLKAFNKYFKTNNKWSTVSNRKYTIEFANEQIVFEKYLGFALTWFLQITIQSGNRQ